MYKNKKKQGKPRIGGMWQKETKKGDTIFSISLNAEHLPEPDENGRIRLTALTNNYKEEDSHPDFNLLEAQAKEGCNGGGYKGGGGRGSDSSGGSHGFKGRTQQRPTKTFQKRAPVQQQEEETEDGNDSDGSDENEVPF